MVHPCVSACVYLLTHNIYGVSDASFPLDPSDNDCTRLLKEYEEDDARYRTSGDRMWTTDDPAVYCKLFRHKKALIGSRMREPGIEELSH